ncbi:hypothetical protein GCM10022280_27180 [Sphingomonas swuensis]|uniref:Uncharacterized protein n=1 Tax=Sphingomonas swuensis TaxID=977800 RepID=A0ABP7TE83_9SPHN
MIELKPGAGMVVVADVRSAFASVDDALLSQARMIVSVLEATQNANIPAGQSQRLLRSMTDGMSSTVEGRAKICSALGEMLEIKKNSNLAPVGYGCPVGWEDLKASAEPVERKAPAKTLA